MKIPYMHYHFVIGCLIQKSLVTNSWPGERESVWQRFSGGMIGCRVNRERLERVVSGHSGRAAAAFLAGIILESFFEKVFKIFSINCYDYCSRSFRATSHQKIPSTSA